MMSDCLITKCLSVIDCETSIYRFLTEWLITYQIRRFRSFFAKSWRCDYYINQTGTLFKYPLNFVEFSFGILKLICGKVFSQSQYELIYSYVLVSVTPFLHFFVPLPPSLLQSSYWPHILHVYKVSIEEVSGNISTPIFKILGPQMGGGWRVKFKNFQNSTPLCSSTQ